MLVNNSNHQGSSGVKRSVGSKESQLIPKDRLELLRKIQSQQGYRDSTQRNIVTDSFVILPQFDDGRLTSMANGQQQQLKKSNGHSNNDIEVDSKGVLSNRISVLSRIFQVASSKSSIDYPICKDCSEVLLNTLKARYDTISKERDVYLQFLEKLKNKSVNSLPMKSEDAVAEIESLRKEEEMLLAELKQLEDKKQALDLKLQTNEQKLEALKAQKQKQAIQSNLQSLEIDSALNQKDRLQTTYQNNMKLLEKLRKINIYNETFQISHNGPFGTINSLRLGSLPEMKVPWQEINAAIGDVVLLLSTISSRLNFKLKGFKLRPMGNFSKIEKYEDLQTVPSSANVKAKHVILECYSSGEYQIERLFNHSKFDDAMLAILAILSQIITRLRQLDQSADVPYEINLEEGKIGGLKLVLNSKVADDEWTGACKLLLTNLKWVLAYSSVNLQAAGR
ncbi:hypothetical protein WICPIJ_007185 [Wickerhamomyces pijperi]|uniref:Autophagy-related protein 6 n=1 Tax=Wickerhamomyces pijperi TaxID=599730 RepID=A0A9P8Q2Y5_WICPI|nr:hypothetical protein WICPIJ_007185 [Wickerhamomyces pijperi]